MCDSNDSLPEGARTVGRFDEAAPQIRLFVWVLRRWLDGACGQQAVWNHFAEKLGTQKAHLATGAIEQLMCEIAVCNRRGLHRHEATCSCVGADEQTLARIVAAAGSGEFTIAYADACSVAAQEGAGRIVGAAAKLGRLLAEVGDAPEPAIQQAVFPPPTERRAERRLH